MLQRIYIWGMFPNLQIILLIWSYLSPQPYAEIFRNSFYHWLMNRIIGTLKLHSILKVSHEPQVITFKASYILKLCFLATLATFKVLSNHRCMMVAILDNTDTGHTHKSRKLYWTHCSERLWFSCTHMAKILVFYVAWRPHPRTLSAHHFTYIQCPYHLVRDVQ